MRWLQSHARFAKHEHGDHFKRGIAGVTESRLFQPAETGQAGLHIVLLADHRRKTNTCAIPTPSEWRPEHEITHPIAQAQGRLIGNAAHACERGITYSLLGKVDCALKCIGRGHLVLDKTDS